MCCSLKERILLPRLKCPISSVVCVKYYQEHDQELNAFHDAQFALESRNVELSAVTNFNIQILQKRLEQAKQNMHNLEEQQRQNERDLKELQHYQKEIDTYLGKKHEDI